MRHILLAPLLAFSILAAPDTPALAIDQAHIDKADAMANKAAAWLRAQQDRETGGWAQPKKDEAGNPTMPHLPGITAIVVTGLQMDKDGTENQSAILGGLKYLLNFQQADGGVYDRMLPSYNTSLALSAFAKSDLEQAREAIPRLQAFLRKLQWGEGAEEALAGGSEVRKVARTHPYYGGVGYGKHGRPDGSNLNFFMEALHDSGVSASDPAVERALVFLSRIQMLDEVNDQPYADGSKQGGFVYATSPDAESVDKHVGQSQAGMMEETLDDGSVQSRLRSYGSMTYAGFKSYLYADLPRDDIRVTAALNWIKDHYTLDENPGCGTDGLYYYFVTFARALDAWGQPVLDVRETPDAKRKKRDWANDLIDKLASLQNADGSFKSVDDRWMEDNPELITAYALIALRTAQHSAPVPEKHEHKSPSAPAPDETASP